MAKSKENKTYDKLTAVLTGLLAISVILNGFMGYEMYFEKYNYSLRLALTTAENWADNYCKISKTVSDGEIESGLKTLWPLSNVLIENYEGHKTLYVSYMQKYRFSQNWADTRYTLNECK